MLAGISKSRNGTKLRCRRSPAAMAAPPFNEDDVRRVDPGIALQVRILWKNGIETFESCEGGPGHSFPEPTVRFHGGSSEGFKALAIALQHGLNVAELRRYYQIISGEPHGPYWEMTFSS